MPSYRFVNDPDSIFENLVGQSRIGVDTEFMREKTYFAQLCLVQISTADNIYCVDPLTNNDNLAFWKHLLDVDWVVHSARQDIEVVYQSAGAMPREIFDTQIAAGLLGFAPQIGYAGLVKELFDVDMAKSHTRADWTRRPLAEAVLQYAAEDVEFLLSAADVLSERLDDKGRLDWARQDSRMLLNPDLYNFSDDQAVERLKGARNFRGRTRSAVMRLAAWRETEAINRDRPRQWILRDPVLLDIACKLPATARQLSEIEGMTPKAVSRIGERLLAAVAASANDTNDYRPPSPPNEAQKALLKEMHSLVADCARDLDLSAETVASKRELSAVIISGNRESRVFSGWRRKLIGEELIGLL